MPGDYLDTSALAKHYHEEAGSIEGDRLWNDLTHELFVSRLSALEIVSAFAGKARAGVISSADFQSLRRRFSADLTRRRRLKGVGLRVSHYQAAEQLIHQHGLHSRLRTLDAIQLAVALDLHRKHVIQRLISADRDLLAVAALEGLDTMNPEHPNR